RKRTARTRTFNEILATMRHKRHKAKPHDLCRWCAFVATFLFRRLEPQPAGAGALPMSGRPCNSLRPSRRPARCSPVKVLRLPRWATAAGLLLSAVGGLAQGANPASPPTQLDPVLVQGRNTDLVGTASSASEGIVGAAQLDQRPLLRRGELLEVVPGVVVTQHSGDGKANQYFLRGFNLDHGTDFSIG